MKKINWDVIKADAILISNPKNIRQFTGLNASFGFVLLDRDNIILFVDGRYFEEANRIFKDGKVILFKNWETIRPYIKNYKTLGVESDYVTLDFFNKFKSIHENIVEISGQYLRKIKANHEIESLKKAVSITMKVMEKASKELSPGKTEKDIERFVVNELYNNGSEKITYWPIVISGVNSSKPHGQATNKKLVEGEMVMFDFAATIDGFTADITRCYKVPGADLDAELQKISGIVKEAQLAGIRAIKPGVKASEIDKICRDYIKEAGYEKFFIHSTGHGLGRDVHELPIISPTSNDILEVGNVITVEPAIYIPNLGGYRIEDDILVTKDGYEIL